MRILSWNINGIRTLPKYHPWNSYSSCEGILNALQADIICFQEMKSSRVQLTRDVALPDSYHSFFSFPVNKGGYSGVAVYTRSQSATPLKAEEGLTGSIQPKFTLTENERVSPSYPMSDHIDMFPDEEGESPTTLEALDTEGRAFVLDFGLFVLINVYCPAETSDSRLPYKMNFHLLLQERVRKLVEEHREVIVLGDINIAATPLDHGDGHLPSRAAVFWEHPPRAWFRDWLEPNGPMVDVIRMYWPERKGMYTCWNMKLQARETNYGARIDYILVTRGLLPWIKHGDIQPSLKGSDHCPVYVDLHDQITLESGQTLTLREAMRQADVTSPPRLAAKYWEELQGKQTVLSSFFGKGKEKQPQVTGKALSHSHSPLMSKEGAVSSLSEPRADASPMTEDHPEPSLANNPAPFAKQPMRPTPSMKRKSDDKTVVVSNKKKKLERGQGSIATFFGKPATAGLQSKAEVIVLDDDTEPPSPSEGPNPTPVDKPSNMSEPLDQIEADYRLACELSASQAELAAESEPIPSSSSQPGKKEAWSNLFAPLKPPNCTVHGEPTRLWTVNKPGPNKGKTFYLCSRPVGPGYDKGRSERLREEVNNEYRCNYFKWASEVKREAMQGKPRQGNRSTDHGDG